MNRGVDMHRVDFWVFDHFVEVGIALLDLECISRLL